MDIRILTLAALSLGACSSNAPDKRIDTVVSGLMTNNEGIAEQASICYTKKLLLPVGLEIKGQHVRRATAKFCDAKPYLEGKLNYSSNDKLIITIYRGQEDKPAMRFEDTGLKGQAILSAFPNGSNSEINYGKVLTKSAETMRSYGYR